LNLVAQTPDVPIYKKEDNGVKSDSNLYDELVNDPMFNQGVQVIVIDLVLFLIIYIVNFCILKPTRFYDKRIMNQKLDD
jgi:hypothetical protein